MARSTPIRIESVPLASRPAALQFLLEQAGPLERFKPESDYAAWCAPCRSEFLIWARSGMRILGAFWGVPTARGRSLQVILPRCAGEAPPDLMDRLLQELRVRMQQDRCARFAQTVIEPGASGLQRAADQLGFRYVANLAWYTCVPQIGVRPSDDLRLVPYEGTTARAELLAVLERTYVNSSDCPSLAGWLEAEDYLAEYESRHTESERAWYFVQSGGETIGCLLCGFAKDDLAELTYWGLVPEARGRRLAGHVLRLMIAQLAHAGKVMVTCVDEGNLAACRALQQTGFMLSNRQQLHICSLAAGGGESGTAFPGTR